MVKPFALLAVAIASAGVLSAQAPDSPALEVASVKPNTSGSRNMTVQSPPSGRFTATNMPLEQLIQNAYQLHSFQLIGGPSWLADRYDIVAVPPQEVVAAGPRPGRFQAMLRALLADRFKLTAHPESRELPIYALVMARSDGRLGPQLRPSAVDCAAAAATARARGNGPAPPLRPGELRPCGMRAGPGSFGSAGLSLGALISSLSANLNRIVLDRTGLKGSFDIELQWTEDQMPRGDLPQGGAPQLADGPSIFTALQEQLGLKLESTKGPVDVLVIDHVERPTED